MSRTVPTGAAPEWPHEPEGNQGQTGEQRVPGSGYGDRRGAPGPRGNGQAYNPQAYDPHGYNGQGREGRGPDGQAYRRQPAGGLAYPERGGYDQQGYGTQGYGSQDRGYPGQPGQQHDAYRDPRRGGEQDYGRRGYAGHGYAGQGYNGQGYNGQGYNGHGYNDQGHAGRGYNDQGYNDQGYNDQGYNDQGYNDQGYADQPTRPYDGYGDPRRDPAPGYADQPTRAYRYQGQGDPRGYPDPGRGYPDPGRDYPAPAPSPAPGPGSGPGGAAPRHRVRFRRLRRFARRPTVRVIGALVGVFLVWVMFSAGQATFRNNGQGVAANLAEWARDHHLGPVVTFGEWLSYNPPKTGGTPSFSLAVPKDQQVTPVKPQKHGFKPNIPATLKPLATGAPLPGEGQWRVVEKVKGQPAILATLLRDAGQHTSYVNGIASIDQRLVKFSLRPGTEDPGAANWGVPNYIPPGQRTGLLATFNGGFKLDSARGGFYLNGIYHGSLVNGAASIVYYKNGTMKVGEWGRDFRMNSQIAGVRQNLNLLVDHGKVSTDANQDVIANFGATLGGGYYVWRSGLGITKDGRIVFVYGPALNAEDLGQLLQRAGAVEGMQMDINPAWMKFDYYTAGSHASDPTPAPLLQNQQPSPYSYYTPSTRDFTAVYAR
jgi:Phosphodiester glycosidase